VAGLVTCSDCYTLDATVDVEDLYGFALNGPAWQLPDLFDLRLGGDARNANPVMPGGTGRSRRYTYLDQTDYQLPLLVIGDVDPDGDLYEGVSILEGFDTNLDLLNGAVGTATFGPGPERAWRLNRPGALDALYAYVQPLGIKKGQIVEAPDWSGYTGLAMAATLTIRVRRGRFEPGVSAP
jgi:hypothetical protein